ncbi:MAG: YegS/Rv2252/BmrU family lipid kinase [Alistipes sp.]|nr:YegS/Rv2252/BmrU family lipid kinase [Alistipes sp.]
MKTLLLYNVKAGRSRAAQKIYRAAREFLLAGYTVELCGIEFDRNPFDGREDTELVVVAGGDGTINYVINCMKAKGLDIAVGIIPAGTANDFAGAVGMSHSAAEAARQIIGGEVQRLDCGCVNGLYYVNVFSFGLFTTTSQHTPDAVKHIIGKGAYIFEGIKELRDLHTIPLHIEADGESFDTEAVMALVFNGETAGSFPLARTADVRDGLLDCLILERRNFLETCRGMIRYLWRGESSQVVYFKARNIKMTTTAEGVQTDVDGQRGADFPLDINCLGGSLRIVCPCRRD